MYDIHLWLLLSPLVETTTFLNILLYTRSFDYCSITLLLGICLADLYFPLIELSNNFIIVIVCGYCVVCHALISFPKPICIFQLSQACCFSVIALGVRLTWFHTVHPDRMDSNNDTFNNNNTYACVHSCMIAIRLFSLYVFSRFLLLSFILFAHRLMIANRKQENHIRS